MQIETIAKLCHEANRALCAAFGDHSQKPWDEAAEWQRKSAIEGVEYRRANPEGPPDAQHVAWMDAKLRDGWTYGAVKDEATKTHPCLVPYAELPPEQRAKDHAFQAIVDACR